MAKAKTSSKKGTHHPTIIKFCGCDHEYQDKTYGKHMRVHNPNKQGDRHRCTVCGQEK